MDKCSSNNFKREANLEDLSWLVVAESLWEQQDIKAKIRKFFLNKFDDKDESSREREWSEITKDVLNNLNFIGLPRKLLSESGIQEVIVRIGEKIFNWTREVMKELKMDIKYAQQICWTPYGTIDDSKILQIYWSRDADLLSYNLNCPSLLSLGCRYFNELYIHEFLMKIGKDVQFSYKSVEFNEKERNVFNIAALFVCCHVFGQEGINTYKKLAELDKETLTGELLILCASAGLNKTIQFVWDHLGLNGQQKYLPLAAKECLVKYPESDKWFKSNDNYRKEKFAEVLTFLLHKMKEKEKYQFLVKNIVLVCEIFLRFWPFQDTVLTVMNCVWDSLSDTKREKLFDLILSYLSRDSKAAFNEIIFKSEPRIIFRKNFAKFYNIIPKYMKKKRIIPNIFDFFKNWDFSSLDLIIHDEDLQDFKEDIIYFYHHDINIIRLGLNPEDGFEHLQKFSRILTHDEKNHLRQKFSYYLEYYVKRHDDFNLANEFLNWLSDSEEEKVTFKRQIDTKKILHELLTEEKYDLIENILKWQFDVQADIDLENFKKECDLKLYECIRWNFFKIWAEMSSLRDVEGIKNRCVKLLTWCLNPNEISIFVKEKLIGNDDTFFLILLYFNANNDHGFLTAKLDELFHFCSTPLQKQNEIKQRLKGYFVKWIENCRYKNLGEVPCLWDPRERRYVYFRFCKFNVLDEIINWICEDKRDRKSIIAKFINSSKGAEYCVKDFADCMIWDSLDPFLDMLNKWLLPCGDISKIKKEVENIVTDSEVELITKYDKLGMVLLLTTLEKENSVTPNDIFRVAEHIKFKIKSDL